MTTLTQRLEEYIAMRRGLGFDMAFDKRVLGVFTKYADANGHTHVTAALFLSWKDNYGRANNTTWGRRLRMVRSFALWLQMRDDRTEVPPLGLVPRPNLRRSPPYIYTALELKLIIVEAGRLRSPYGLRGALYATVFGLIAVTGLRVSEALHLERSDVDLDNGLLNVKKTKNGCGRLIPIRPCVVERLERYAAERDRLVDTKSSRFFIQEHGAPASPEGARYNFGQVLQQLGLRKPQRFCRYGIGPRIHDLRHTFAVHTVLDWFHAGRDIDGEMYRLTAYMGHTNPKNTYWYMEAIPELVQLAMERAEARHRREEM